MFIYHDAIKFNTNYSGVNTFVPIYKIPLFF
jgi:hypothetical protein